MRLAAFALIGLLAACQPSPDTAAPNAAAAASAADTAPPADAAPDASAGAVPNVAPAAPGALHGALVVLASEQPPAWDRLQAVPGLPALVPADGIEGYPKGLSARLTLAGFDVAVLPDGGVGAGAGTREGNEGEAMATFAGTEDSVRTLIVRKFYPRTDYARALRAQLQPGDRLVRRDGVCDDAAPVATDAPTEYWLALQGGERTLAVSASVAEGGKSGPGYTDFEFRRGGADIQLPDCGA
ncbi:hypothetical protein LDO32_00670 [Luteimonas sp. Y-2-2-4F]|nr:hypothetical protein [Luteimonas sp. Y-2-2-4F]MCD9030249.1 hypothetical protein [Luteimonas sp. Y-2-2-4F]